MLNRYCNQNSSDQVCSDHLNSDGTQVIIFVSDPSTKAVPSSVSQVGIDITFTGGESDVFNGVRGFFILRSDDLQYIADFPVEFIKSSSGSESPALLCGC